MSETQPTQSEATCKGFAATLLAPKKKSLSGHQSASMLTDQWVTPRSIVQPLGAFDLDPCSFDGHPWPIARCSYTERENGMARNWFGRVWLNPPFGQRAAAWMERMAIHGNGIALIPARTETKMFFEWVWDWADAILFMRGRPHFCYPNGTVAPFNSGAPIVLIAYGERNGRILESSGIAGRLLWIKRVPQIQDAHHNANAVSVSPKETASAQAPEGKK